MILKISVIVIFICFYTYMYIFFQDKKTIGISSKPGSLRGIRLKQDKLNNHNSNEGNSGGKENIPMTVSSKSATVSMVKPSVLTELVDLVSDDSQSPSKVSIFFF